MPNYEIESLDPKKHILIKGARLHNLKNIDVAIPRNKFVVITGLSGSGKSSLAFDTLFAEGQRRYIESLSSYARQFLGKIEKPEVDYIKGISPAIAIEQKVNTYNSRSTVGTSSEIYDYLKLLFARIGKTVSPVTGEEIKRETVSDVVHFITQQEIGSRIWILTTLPEDGRKKNKVLKTLLQQGFSRVIHKDRPVRIEDLLTEKKIEDFEVVIDRLLISEESKEETGRIADSVETAFYEGKGFCSILVENGENGERRQFSNRFEENGTEYIEPNEHLFSFNNPLGACPSCEGFGKVIGIDEDLVIPDRSLSVYGDAVAPWKSEKMSEWKEAFTIRASKAGFPVHKAIHDLSEEQYNLLWNGSKSVEGIHNFFEYVTRKSYKINYRVLLSRYRGKTTCPNCKGKRLRKEAEYVKVSGKSITDLTTVSIKDLHAFFLNVQLNQHEQEVSKRLLTEISNRIKYLLDVGVGYLTLNRSSATLSGGESQRINLATSLGSSLVGSMYILDEPSIGLHPRDTERLIGILKHLRDLGNTVIVVEHDADIILAADEVIDLGPLAGSHGGELIFQGNQQKLLADEQSLTAQYLTGKKEVQKKKEPRKWNKYIAIEGATENNLKNIDVKVPLHAMVVISGVSGSGKSSLMKKIIYPAIKKLKGGYGEKTGTFKKLSGDLKAIDEIQYIDQNPIGRSSRSNPVTYVKAYDDIRNLYAGLSLSKTRGYKPAHFSFNVEGGRCDICKGEGVITVEMQFMADIHLTCEQCGGKRFKDEILDVQFHGLNIHGLLELTIEDAVEFFHKHEKEDRYCMKIVKKLEPLQKVGLGYVKLGQSSDTLSGGEAQRIKLAFYLQESGKKEHKVFLFDEPTTGLHFHDINKLLIAFEELIKKGHSLIIVEHNTEVIKSADWVIELGPEGGKEGGYLLFEGTPQDLGTSKKSVTASYL